MMLVCQSISAPIAARLGKPGDLGHPVADRDQKHPTFGHDASKYQRPREVARRPRGALEAGSCSASATSICPYRMPDDADALGAQCRNPCLTLAAEHLTHVGIWTIARKAIELLSRGIKAHNGIGSPFREPHLVVGREPRGVGARYRAWQPPCGSDLSIGS